MPTAEKVDQKLPKLITNLIKFLSQPKFKHKPYSFYRAQCNSEIKLSQAGAALSIDWYVQCIHDKFCS